MGPLKRGIQLLFGAVLLMAGPVAATTLLQMDLADLTERADRIFRATVVDVAPGTVSAGGGELPTAIYRLRVDESFKGSPDIVKGGIGLVEIQMIGSIKPPTTDGDLRRFSVFRDVPRLEMGSDYLLFTTEASAAGLSTTVGLGQGAFSVFSRNKQVFAVNQFDNVGLGLDSAGPVSYAELSAEIRTLLGQNIPRGGCGVGFELAFLLPPLVWLEGRRRRRRSPERDDARAGFPGGRGR